MTWNLPLWVVRKSIPWQWWQTMATRPLGHQGYWPPSLLVIRVGGHKGYCPPGLLVIGTIGHRGCWRSGLLALRVTGHWGCWWSGQLEQVYGCRQLLLTWSLQRIRVRVLYELLNWYRERLSFSFIISWNHHGGVGVVRCLDLTQMISEVHRNWAFTGRIACFGHNPTAAGLVHWCYWYSQ